MKFTEYISNHQVFRTEDLLSSVSSPYAAREQLRLALKKGTVKSVRRGLYVSQKGRFEGTQPDPFKIPLVADNECVFVLHSALELHGVAHNVSFECVFRSEKVLQGFSYGCTRFKPLRTQTNIKTQFLRRDDFVCPVTTKEQTLLDCLTVPSRAGGFEEVLRSVSAYTYLDFEVLRNLTKGASLTLCARLGWLLNEKLQDWRVPEDFLEELSDQLDRGPYLMGNSKDKRRSLSKKWRLYLPYDEKEVQSWIQH